MNGKADWYRRARTSKCALCGTDRLVKGHHVITQQEIGKVTRSRGLDYERYRWDQRNFLPLCEDCHIRHHSRMAPVGLVVILASCPKIMEFAGELKLQWWLSRTYPLRGRPGRSAGLRGPRPTQDPR